MLLLRTAGMAKAMLMFGSADAAGGQRMIPEEVRAAEYALKQQWVAPESQPVTILATI